MVKGHKRCFFFFFLEGPICPTLFSIGTTLRVYSKLFCVNLKCHFSHEQKYGKGNVFKVYEAILRCIESIETWIYCMDDDLIMFRLESSDCGFIGF